MSWYVVAWKYRGVEQNSEKMMHADAVAFWDRKFKQGYEMVSARPR